MLPKNARKDSSVLGITRLKSLKPVLSSDPFLNRALKPRWTVSLYCWKGLQLPFPCFHSPLLSFGEEHSWWENRAVFVIRFTALLLFNTLKLKLMSRILNWNWTAGLLQSNVGPSILSQGAGCTYWSWESTHMSWESKAKRLSYLLYGLKKEKEKSRPRDTAFWHSKEHFSAVIQFEEQLSFTQVITASES